MSSVEIRDARIVVDGQPVQLISGAMHYFRIPAELWRDRLEKAVAMGLNCVETYMPWNWHEPVRGQFDFTGMLDVERFIRLAGEMGLYVVVRPGPYICAEWDNGGIPSWLMNEPGLRVRRINEPWQRAVADYFRAVMPRLCPLQHDHGGPIILMQIENEYGSYGHDRAYMEWLRRLMVDCGATVPLFTADGASEFFLANGMVEGVPSFLTGGSRLAEGARLIRRLRPQDPVFFMEFWCGWFNAWGKPHAGASRTPQQIASELDDILREGGSVNIYMFHGGCNFGYSAGANLYGGKLTPDTSSYDYGAPLNEYGEPTELYDAFREVIRKYRPETPTVRPKPVAIRAYGDVAITASAPLFGQLDAIASPVRTVSPETMETLGQPSGFVLYRTRLEDPITTSLDLWNVHDLAWVFLDGKPAGRIYRNDDCRSLKDIRVPEGGLTVDILVEALGRINYGPELARDFKGIVGDVCLGGQVTRVGWTSWCLPQGVPTGLVWGEPQPGCRLPAYHRAVLELPDEPADTFLRFPGVCGVVWVNGFLLGRYWNVGPEKSLYVPAPLLRRGRNEIVVFETEALSAPCLSFSADGVLA